MSSAQIEAGTRNVAPYKWQRGVSANPGGRRKGVTEPKSAYQRLGSMNAENLRAYKPADVIEEGIKNCLLRACDSTSWKAAHAAVKEIVDRIEGKAVARTADVSEVEIARQAQALFASCRRFADAFANDVRAALEAIPVDSQSAAPLQALLASLTVPDSEIIEEVVGLFDEGQAEIVLRALEG